MESRQSRHGGSLRSAPCCHGTRDCSPHPWGSPLRTVRCRASLRLSLSLPADLSLAEAGCRSEQRRSRWPKGARRWMRRVTERFRPRLSLRQIRKTPHEGARFDQRHVGVARGIARLIHEPRPSALRAPGPACGCPDSLPANRSLAEAGCRSEQRRSR
jgi:hypothetical protein